VIDNSNYLVYWCPSLRNSRQGHCPWGRFPIINCNKFHVYCLHRRHVHQIDWFLFPIWEKGSGPCFLLAHHIINLFVNLMHSLIGWSDFGKVDFWQMKDISRSVPTPTHSLTNFHPILPSLVIILIWIGHHRHSLVNVKYQVLELVLLDLLDKFL